MEIDFETSSMSWILRSAQNDNSVYVLTFQLFNGSTA